MKLLTSASALCAILIATLAFVPGCQLTPEQSKTIAQQTGLFAAVGWIAADNPTAEEIAAVETIVDTIVTKADDVTAGKTYTEVVYPELVKVINQMLEPQYKPLAKAASLSLLGSIDMMFALHPEWKEDEALAIDLVKAFVTGAKQGLGLDSAHPAMKRARETAAMRLDVLSKRAK